MLEVTVYDSPSQTDPQVFEHIDFVSLISNETYGPPALIAPSRGNPTTSNGPVRAKIGERVLYVNTNLVPVFEMVRTSD